MRRRQLLYALTISLAVTDASFAQQSPADSLRVALNGSSPPGHIAAPAAPRASAAMAAVFQNGYGMANLEHDIPITPASIFHVASVSKQFTAMAVMLLAADGKLSLDDDIRKHLPEIPDYGHTITIRHLLTHTSGLRDQWDLLVHGAAGGSRRTGSPRPTCWRSSPARRRSTSCPGRSTSTATPATPWPGPSCSG